MMNQNIEPERYDNFLFLFGKLTIVLLARGWSFRPILVCEFWIQSGSRAGLYHTSRRVNSDILETSPAKSWQDFVVANPAYCWILVS